jgi:hypothetical protein
MWEKTSDGAGRGTESCDSFLVAPRRSLYPRIGADVYPFVCMVCFVRFCFFVAFVTPDRVFVAVVLILADVSYAVRRTETSAIDMTGWPLWPLLTAITRSTRSPSPSALGPFAIAQVYA